MINTKAPSLPVKTGGARDRPLQRRSIMAECASHITSHARANGVAPLASRAAVISIHECDGSHKQRWESNRRAETHYKRADGFHLYTITSRVRFVRMATILAG